MHTCRLQIIFFLYSWFNKSVLNSGMTMLLIFWVNNIGIFISAWEVALRVSLSKKRWLANSTAIVVFCCLYRLTYFKNAILIKWYHKLIVVLSCVYIISDFLVLFNIVIRKCNVNEGNLFMNPWLLLHNARLVEMLFILICLFACLLLLFFFVFFVCWILVMRLRHMKYLIF